MERWIQTHSGRKFDPWNFTSNDIRIVDIAHALSNVCRYAGHCNRHYSVAEHCIVLYDYFKAKNVGREILLWALLHDAAEAYIGDIPRDIKAEIKSFQDIEERILTAVAHRYNLKWPMPLEVKDADLRILKDEKDELMNVDIEWPCVSNVDCLYVGYLIDKYSNYDFEQIENAFIARFIDGFEMPT